MWKTLLSLIVALGTAAFAAEPVLSLSSPAFRDGAPIPAVYTCQGADVPPPLRWTGVSPDARSLVLIVEDPDAPDPRAPKMTWVHWVLYDLPPGDGGIGEGRLPPGSASGRNGWNRTGYGGPCPPIGRHRYFFRLYALDTRLKFGDTPGKAEVVKAMAGHVLQRAVLMGTYEKE
jgi:Raf kinase inhibitor-like YbhB/YbcL family protein